MATANVLSVCLFYFGEANKIKSKKKNKVTVISGLRHKTVQRLEKYFGVLPLAHPIECCNSGKVCKQRFKAVRSLRGGKRGRACVKKRKTSSSAVIKMTLYKFFLVVKYGSP